MNKDLLKFLVIGFGLILALNACMHRKNYFPESIHGKFMIQEIRNGNFSQKFDEKAYVLSFDSGRFSAYIGCNRIGGTYQEHEWSIRFSEIMSTKMYCANKSAQESALLNCLSGVVGRKEEKGFLVLEKQDSTYIKLQKVPL